MPLLSLSPSLRWCTHSLLQEELELSEVPTAVLSKPASIEVSARQAARATEDPEQTLPLSRTVSEAIMGNGGGQLVNLQMILTLSVTLYATCAHTRLPETRLGLSLNHQDAHCVAGAAQKPGRPRLVAPPPPPPPQPSGPGAESSGQRAAQERPVMGPPPSRPR